MKIFFDCDETIITWDVRLRPGVKEVIGSLRDSGHEIYLWSGNGPRWEIVRRFDLHDFFLDCYWKPLYRHHERLEELGIPFTPDFVIDDHQEVVDAFGGVRIEPPADELSKDRELWRVYDVITDHVQTLKGD